jgi:hypothetical protein
MPKTTLYSTNLLKLLFQNAAYANVGDAGGLQPSAGAGSLYVSLHNAPPGVAGDQTTNETAYGGYSRVGVARSGAGWTVSGGNASNAADVSFPACTSGSDTITYFGVGTASSGAGQLLYSFPLVPAYATCHCEMDNDRVHINELTWNVNDPVQFAETIDGPFPGGIAVGTTYYIKELIAGMTDQWHISATIGGPKLDFTLDGFALIGHIGSLAVSTGVTPLFVAATLVITET